MLGLDAQEPVPLGRALGALRRSDLDLPAPPADREIGEPAVLGVARARRDDGRIALALCELERLARARERARLVGLHEHRIRDARGDAVREPLRGGREEIVPEQLDVRAEPLRDGAPGLPVVLAQRILDRDQRVAASPVGDQAHHGGAVEMAILALEPVAVAVAQLRRGDVERECGLDAGALDRARPDLECLVVGGERRRQPALVGHERRLVAALPQLCGRAGAHQRRVLDRLGERAWRRVGSRARPARRPRARHARRRRARSPSAAGAAGRNPGRAGARAACGRPPPPPARTRPMPPGRRWRRDARGPGCRRGRAARRRRRPARRRRARAASRRSRR